jgi:hypothetical protein
MNEISEMIGWAKEIAPALVDNFQPTSLREPTTWRAQRDNYQFGGLTAEDVGDRFADWNERIRIAADEIEISGIVEEIKTWGKVRGGKSFTATNITRVLDASLGIASAQSGNWGNLANGVPWNSSWTKIACAATFHLDRPAAGDALPLVIWDSRVAVAVVECIRSAMLSEALSEQSAARLQSVLLIPPARPDVGFERRSDRVKSRRLSGWKGAPHWQTPGASTRLWRSQLCGSAICSAIANELNQRFPREKWTSFDVGLALFMRGY